jgi:hypothetical protein
MSLSIALINPRQTILVTDRRFTDENGQLCSDEGSKLAILFCRDARAAVAHTGLAGARRFSTHQWLLQSVCDAAKPDFQLRQTVDRLAQIATRDIANLSLPKALARLSVIVCGYYLGEPPPLAFLCRITNFENDDGSAEALARDHFSVTCLREERHPEGTPTKVFFSGVWQAVSLQDRRALEELLSGGRPAQALVGKAVEIIRSCAKSERSGGLIGEQCLSALIPRDPTRRILTHYHSSTVTYQMFMPSIINAIAPQTLGYMMNPLLAAVPGQQNVPPLAVPKVGRNRPCPCGSRKKYKHCHGKIDEFHYRRA